MASKVVKAGLGIGAVSGVALNVANEINNGMKTKLLDKRHTAKTKLELQKAIIEEKQKTVHANVNETAISLINIQADIDDEKEKMKSFANVKNDENTLLIVALGVTGHGKSTTLNRLQGDMSKYGANGPFETDDSDESVTQEPNHRVCQIQNNRCILVDTPGYNDTKNRDDLHFNNLEKYLYGSGGVDAFLLIRNATNSRFDGNFKKMLTEYTEYFGTNFWKHLVVILTHVEGYTKERFGKKKLDKLQQNLSEMMPPIFVEQKVKIPVIPIGFDANLNAFRNDVMGAIVKISRFNAKLNCKNIKSPIKKLKEKCKKLKEEKQKYNKKIATQDRMVKGIDFKIAPLQKMIDEPEQFPLLSNFNMEI